MLILLLLVCSQSLHILTRSSGRARISKAGIKDLSCLLPVVMPKNHQRKEPASERLANSPGPMPKQGRFQGMGPSGRSHACIENCAGFNGKRTRSREKAAVNDYQVLAQTAHIGCGWSDKPCKEVCF